MEVGSAGSNDGGYLKRKVLPFNRKRLEEDTEVFSRRNIDEESGLGNGACWAG